MKKFTFLTGLALLHFSFAGAQTQTYNYTGGVQTYTVPACVTSITVDVQGAQGGAGPVGCNSYQGVAGLGGRIQATIPVTAGDVLTIYVGGAGTPDNNSSAAGGFNGGGNAMNEPNYTYYGGGGGGGASDIRLNGNSLTDRVIVAGGGGGGGADGCTCGGLDGGNGGGLIGASGNPGGMCSCNPSGQGGSQVAGGARGDWGCSCDATAGAFGIGGNSNSSSCGGPTGGGGGGGGYYGGGGGGLGAGGGGSNYSIGTATGVINTTGFRSGNGIVIITPNTGATAPGPLTSGSTTVCANSTGTYSIASLPGATSYTWSVPVGTTINSGQGTNTINITAGSTSGTISVFATYPCGSSAATNYTLTINPNPTVGLTVTPATTVCAGTSVTLSGTGASSYSWSGGITDGVPFVPVSTTTYTVTGTTAGCSGTASQTITVNPLPTVGVTVSPSSTVCAGTSVTLSGTGATSYSWSGGVTNGVPFVPVSTTTYTVTGTLAGCTGNATQTITVNPLPTVGSTVSPATTVCAGTSVTLSGTGATTYAWSGGVTNAVAFVPVATTTYTVTGTDGNGCSNTATRIITVNPLPTVGSTVSPATTVCAGTSVTLSGTGATTYAWSGGVTNAVAFVPVATTTYTVTGTDGNGCSNTATRTITVNPLPTVGSTTSPSTTVCAGTSVTLSGTGATTYAWSGGVTDAVAFVPVATTTYTVTGTDGNGCTNTATQTITVNPLPTVGSTTSPATTVCAGTSVTLSGTGATTYAWSGGVTDAVAFVPVATTTYTVTGTDGNGCTNTATQTITVNPLPTVGSTTSPATTVCAGTSVTLSGTGATTYAWSGGVTDAVAFVPVATTTYTVTGTDGNGCTNTATQTITVNPLPTVGSTTSPATTVCAGTSVTLSGTGATTYAWSGGVTDAVAFVPVSTTTYTVTGTDGNGCTNTATQTITVNPLPTVGSTTSPATTVCAGTSVTLSGTGATTYAWSGGVTDAVAFVPVATTTYTVTGTDGNGCTNTATQTITVNPLPTVTASATANTVCAGTSVTLTGNGATSYSWSGGVTDGVSFVPTVTDTYTVTGTDANGCTNTATQTVTVNPLPTVTASATANTVCAGTSVTLTGSGATSYAWSGGVTDGISFVPTITDTYTVTGTDANGCVNTTTITVNVNALPVVSLGPDVAQCSGTILLDAGNVGSTYLWSDASNTQTISVSTSGTYYVDVTDANGCMGSDTVVATINSNPTVTLGADIVQCGGTVTLDAGNSGATYAWSDGSSTQQITVSTSGIYFVTDTLVGGCYASDTINVTINPLPTVTASSTDIDMCLNDAPATLSGTPVSGIWSGPGVTGNSFDPMSAGTGTQTCTYTFTDANGCTNTATVNILVNACTGVVESSLENGVNVYPNPNNGTFTISIDANVGDLTIEITDMQGRVVYSSMENNVQAGFSKQVSMENVANGMYMLRLTTNGAQKIEKISVQK